MAMRMRRSGIVNCAQENIPSVSASAADVTTLRRVLKYTGNAPFSLGCYLSWNGSLSVK